MVKNYNVFNDFEMFSIDSFYPTQKERIENPLPVHYEVGSKVKILVGPATRDGAVVVDGNRN